MCGNTAFSYLSGEFVFSVFFPAAKTIDIIGHFDMSRRINTIQNHIQSSTGNKSTFYRKTTDEILYKLFEFSYTITIFLSMTSRI